MSYEREKYERYLKSKEQVETALELIDTLEMAIRDVGKNKNLKIYVDELDDMISDIKSDISDDVETVSDYERKEYEDEKNCLSAHEF